MALKYVWKVVLGIEELKDTLQWLQRQHSLHPFQAFCVFPVTMANN